MSFPSARCSVSLSGNLITIRMTLTLTAALDDGKTSLTHAAILGVGFEQDHVGLARNGTDLLGLRPHGVLSPSGQMGGLPDGETE